MDIIFFGCILKGLVKFSSFLIKYIFSAKSKAYKKEGSLNSNRNKVM